MKLYHLQLFNSDQAKIIFWVAIKRVSPALDNNEVKKSRYIKMLIMLDCTHIVKGLVKKHMCLIAGDHCI